MTIDSVQICFNDIKTEILLLITLQEKKNSKLNLKLNSIKFYTTTGSVK